MNEAEAEKIVGIEGADRSCLDYLQAFAVNEMRLCTEDHEHSDHEARPAMLAALIAANVVTLDTYWFKKDWPADAQRAPCLVVACDEVFSAGRSDFEVLTYGEIENLFSLWCIDNNVGPAVWCIKKRGAMPHPSVEDKIIKTGKWDIHSFDQYIHNAP